MSNSIYLPYNHDAEHFYEACGIDVSLVKKIHTKISTDVQEKKKLSEVVEEIEIGLTKPETAEKLARPVAVILAKSITEELGKEEVLEAVAKAMSSGLKDISSKSGSTLDSLDIPKDEVKRYIKVLVERHKKP